MTRGTLWDAIATLRAEVWIALLWLVLFLNAGSGYLSFNTNEDRIGAYAMDVLQNGDWIAQEDGTGSFMTKPPGMTWLVVLFSKVFGGLNCWTLYLPSALAELGVALLLLSAGRRHFSARAGIFAALMFLVSYTGDRQLLTTRYDGLFTLPVALGAFAVYRAWVSGRGWFVFWIAMTAGVMVKGPLAFVLALMGLGAAIWERNPGHLFHWNRQHASGLLLFLLVCGGWFALVFTNYHDQFLNTIIGRELLGHAVSDGGKAYPGRYFWQAPTSIFLQFLPWSVLGVLAIVRTIQGRQAASRFSFDRYLVCWFLGGLLVFALAAHQRGRLTWPLLPPLALLAARQLELWLQARPDRLVYRFATAGAVGFVLFSGVFHQVLLGRSEHCRENLVLHRIAQKLRTEFGEQPPIAYVDTPFAVQFYLGYLRTEVNTSAAQRLLEKAAPAYVLASGESAQELMTRARSPIFCLENWRLSRKESVLLLGNRPSYSAVP